MDHAFTCRLEPDDASGMLLQFVDVPEAHTFAPTAPDATTDPALDCLIGALGGYIKLGRKIPRPSPAQGRAVAILPPLVAAKLTLYDAMRSERITRTALARRVGLQENAIRRLLDLDHRSHIDQIARALAARQARRGARAGAGMNSVRVPPISEGPPRSESDLTCATERFLAPFSPRPRCSEQTP